MSVSAVEGSPVLVLLAQAPDVLTAVRLVDAVAFALRDYAFELVESSNIPTTSRLRLRQLGAPRSSVVEPGPALTTVFLTGLVLWLTLAVLIVGGRLLVRQARLERRATLSSATTG